MCRHIGYIGNKKNLASILLDHNHSLIEMSYKPKEMKEATLNAGVFKWTKRSTAVSSNAVENRVIPNL